MFALLYSTFRGLASVATSALSFSAVVFAHVLFANGSFASSTIEPPQFAVWSEFLSTSALEQNLTALKKQNLALYLAFPEKVLKDEKLLQEKISILKKAEEAGVEYRIWPLLDVENGYWLNRWNVGYYQETALNIILKLRENGLHPSWISLDMEPPPAIIQGLVQNLKKLKIKKAVRTLGKTCDLRAHTESIQEFRKLFDALKANGLLVHAVTTPFILNDYETGKPQVQTVLGVPLSCCAFDEVSFMAYRSEYENVMGRMNSKLVYDSAKLAKKHFGDRAAIDLGVLGNIEFPNVVHGIQNQKGLLKDVNAAMKGGVSKIHFYSLEGWLSILQKNELESAAGWFNDLEPRASKTSVKYSLIKWATSKMMVNACSL